MTSPTAWAPLPTSTNAPRLPTRAAIAAYTMPFPQTGMMVFCEETGFQDPYYFVLQSPDVVNGTTVLATSAGGTSRWIAKGGTAGAVLAGDVTGPLASNIVERVTGVGGILAMAATAAALTWAAATLAPMIAQVDPAVGVVAAQDMTIKAQRSLNVAGLGGDVFLKAGTGALLDGNITSWGSRIQSAKADGTVWVEDINPDPNALRLLLAAPNPNESVIRFTANAVNGSWFGFSGPSDPTANAINSKGVVAFGPVVAQDALIRCAQTADAITNIIKTRLINIIDPNSPDARIIDTVHSSIGPTETLEIGDGKWTATLVWGKSRIDTIDPAPGNAWIGEIEGTGHVWQRTYNAGVARMTWGGPLSNTTTLTIYSMDDRNAAGAGADWSVRAQTNIFAGGIGGNLDLRAGNAPNGAGIGGNLILTLGAGAATNGNLLITNINSTATATGGAAAIPANAVGYIDVNINGTARKIAYFDP